MRTQTAIAAAAGVDADAALEDAAAVALTAARRPSRGLATRTVPAAAAPTRALLLRHIPRRQREPRATGRAFSKAHTPALCVNSIIEEQ